MAINWNELKKDMKKAANNSKVKNNTDTVIDSFVDALKKQIDKADIVGVDSRGDTLVKATIK